MTENNIDLLELNSPNKEKKQDLELKENKLLMHVYETSYELDGYKVSVKLCDENSKLLLKIDESSNKKYYYRYTANLEELQNLTVLFGLYKTVEEIFDIINKYFENNKVKIEANEEGLQLILMMIFPDFSVKNVAVNLTKVIKAEKYGDEVISELMERISALEKKQKDVDLLTKFLNLSIDSVIIQDSSQLILLKEELLRKKGGQKSCFKLLYRGTRDDDSNESFSSKCKGAKPLIFLIKTRKNLVFGGYMETEWKNDDLFTYDENAFIFSLDKMKVYPLKEGTTVQVCCNNNFMAYFAGGFQIKQNYFTDADCKAFPLNGCNFDKLTIEYEITNGETKFEVAEIEVFQVLNIS